MSVDLRQTKEELKQHLQEQIGFLQTSADAFDGGDFSEAKRMAVVVRVLLHDTAKSSSLLNQLGTKGQLQFYDTAIPQISNEIGPYTGLVLKAVGREGGKYVAFLDDIPPGISPKRVSFDDYWKQVIFVDNDKALYTRKDVILALANQDGGAHVDSDLKEGYANLSRKNSLGWNFGTYSGAEGTLMPLAHPVPAAVRQIAHEILKTLVDNYPEKKLLSKETGAMLGEIWIEHGANAGVLIGTNPRLIKPNLWGGQLCPCRSGRSWDQCGQLNTAEHIRRMGR